MPTIALTMIVKNEAHVIRRCLDGVAPLVDFVLVEDTGSTDGTQNIIRAHLAELGLPGRVVERPWVNFAENRSSVLAELHRREQHIDYAFMMDADDLLERGPDFDPASFKASLSADLYFAALVSQGKTGYRAAICRNDGRFLYRGVLHEFLDTADHAMSYGPGRVTRDVARGLRIVSLREGARNLSAHKYRDDAAILTHALKSEADPFLRARYFFYLGNSLWDAGERKRALKAYEQRAELGFWDEEIYVSLYHAAQIKIELSCPAADIVGTFLRAYELCPHRAEALHGAARYCRAAEKYHQAYLFASAARDLRCPADGLFIHPEIYDHGIPDELSVAAFWTGRYAESIAVAERFLASGRMPEDFRARVEANVALARARLAETPRPVRPDLILGPSLAIPP